MIVVLTPDRLLNPAVTQMTRVPMPVLDRGRLVLPRPAFGRAFLRCLLEHALVRYTLALSPFPLAMLLWPRFALPIAQAPLLMIVVVWLVETHVLSRPKEARQRLVDPDRRALGADRLRARGRAILAEIAAGRGMADGQLTLVVETSEMARIPPLTLVSVQVPGARRMEPLTGAEAALIEARLFDGPPDERHWHRIAGAEGTHLLSVTLEARAVSARQRLRAMGAGS